MSAVDLPNLNVDTPMTPVQETHFGRVNMFNVWYGYKQLSSCYWYNCYCSPAAVLILF